MGAISELLQLFILVDANQLQSIKLWLQQYLDYFIEDLIHLAIEVGYAPW
jgi:hypothetical protein